LSTIHTAAGSGAHGVGAIVSLPDACTTFHRYQMLWTTRDIRFGIDGLEHLIYPRLAIGTQDEKRAWPFDAAQFLLLNVAVGGNLGGPIDDNIFPVSMEVDYVRVWQPSRPPLRTNPTVSP
jgi:beta-glucanase (GH16 family)